MHKVFLSLGSNIHRYTHLNNALRALESGFGELVCSPVYESEAVGFDGDHFLNMVVMIQTSLGCGELNHWLKNLENENGRERQQPKFSPRTLDIDILLYDDVCGELDYIDLPRDEVLTNAFVLRPMADIAPETLLPGTHDSMAELWSRYDQSVQKLWPVLFIRN